MNQKAYDRTHFARSAGMLGAAICGETASTMSTVTLWKYVTCHNCLAEKPKEEARD